MFSQKLDKNKAFAEKCVTNTAKHGVGLVMVCGCMAASSVGILVFINSTMNKLEKLALLGIESLNRTIRTDPKHKSKIVSEWLLCRTSKNLNHSPQFPDFNNIRRIRQMNISSKND